MEEREKERERERGESERASERERERERENSRRLAVSSTPKDTASVHQRASKVLQSIESVRGRRQCCVRYAERGSG